MVKHGWAMALVVAMATGSAAARAEGPMPPSPKEFAAAMAGSDRYEVLAATAALAQSRDERVRAFAQEMMGDHERLDAALREAVRKAGLPEPPPAMLADQASLLGSLQGLVGAAFDRAYAGQQVLAHAQAVAVGESFAATGSEATLRNVAESALPTIRDHLTKAQHLREALGTP